MPVTVAVIDSGVNPMNPHIGGVVGGVGFAPDGTAHEDYVDRLGHGTAVTAAIHEKAPRAALYAVKVFDRALDTDIGALVAAIDWAVERRVRLVNLSLGTPNQEHEEMLRGAVNRAAARDVIIVAAGEQDGTRWLPGALPGVIAVELDWTCPRDEYRVAERRGGRVVFRASGYPREIPGVPPERNLKGLSFAVANVAGFVARALETNPNARSADEVVALLEQS